MIQYFVSGNKMIDSLIHESYYYDTDKVNKDLTSVSSRVNIIISLKIEI